VDCSSRLLVQQCFPLCCRQDEAGGQSDSAYTLLEVAVLARSSVAGQRAAALRLLAGALEQARQISGLCCGTQGVGSGWRHCASWSACCSTHGSFQGFSTLSTGSVGIHGRYLSLHELAWHWMQGRTCM
jgi:RPAP1-like, C-terminal